MTDYNHKLMGNKVTAYLHDIHCQVTSVPPKHQHQNSLVKRNWRSVVRMDRSWLNSSLLPSSFCFYAIKCEVEVSNYLPIQLRGQITTPFELAHHIKSDIRTLIPMFSIAYSDKQSDSASIRKNLHSQSLRVIVIGRCNESNCVQFYHPPSKKILTSAVYKLDPTLAADPIFNLKYDGRLFFNTYHNEADLYLQSTHTLDSIIIKIKEYPNQYTAAKVIDIPSPGSDIYTLQHLATNNIFNMPNDRLLPYNPNAKPYDVLKDRDNTLPSWIKNNAPATILIDDMEKPKRGNLVLH